MNEPPPMTLEDIRLLVTMIIHDLEKPMAVNTRILGRILDGSIDPRNPAHQRLIRSSWHASVRLRRMLGDLNDVLDGRRISAHKQPHSAADLITMVAQEFVPITEEEDIRFSWSGDKTGMVNTDSDLVQRILLNYLYNAAAHTCAGDDIRMDSDAGSPGWVVIRVTNTGLSFPGSLWTACSNPGFSST